MITSAAGFTFSRGPAIKLSSTRTREPSPISASVRCDPIKPAPPVTNARRGFEFVSKDDIARKVTGRESKVRDYLRKSAYRGAVHCPRGSAFGSPEERLPAAPSVSPYQESARRNVGNRTHR